MIKNGNMVAIRNDWPPSSIPHDYRNCLSKIISLSSRLHNVNAAAIAGTLVVFDELHLMPPDKAFLTAVAGIRAFRGLCQSVWMTATATSPLERILCSALNTVPVPENEAAMRTLLSSLPSVNSVFRTLIWEEGPLTAEAVLSHHEKRSIALTNTVGRAQALFEQIREKLLGQPHVQLILLHSRFFKNDRQRKERLLKQLFGSHAQGNAILVATQVIEAGIDISCEHLHTELCPMNALVQRAGRCARFPNDKGTVHVYELPAERGWLPYGTLVEAEPSIDATRDLLKTATPITLDPHVVGRWVEAVHSNGDGQAVKTGVKDRSNRSFEAIHQNAIQRAPVGIAHLIRGDDSESIRIIVSEGVHLPESPGKLESISMSRWSLAPYLSPLSPFGWYWDGDELEPWKVLTNRADLARTYAVALPLEFASYDDAIGLRLGRPGRRESPQRQEPPRPGYLPLREESWVNHALMVADSAEDHLWRERFPSGLASSGFRELYGLSPEQVRIAVRACGLLHDLGKLQFRWQQWAEKWQMARNPSYQFAVPLAHTDFNPDNPSDRERQRNMPIRRPPHAAASAYYACSLLKSALIGIPETLIDEVASACVAAIIAHHGAFIPNTPGMNLGILQLSKGWEQTAAECGCIADPAVVKYLSNERDKRGCLTDVLKITTSRDALEKWWPLVSYLTRTLRLSDQRATSEWACSE
jgi:CRISPR-associated endonuclease/helicase Cas3